MKTLLLSLFLLFGLQSIAQTYVPYPIVRTSWSHEYIDGNNPVYTIDVIVWDGDTIIGGETYMKMYYNGAYYGANRQDTLNEQIFFLDLNNVEHDVSVEQNLSIGDTIIVTEQTFRAFLNWYFPTDTFVVHTIFGPDYYALESINFASPWIGGFNFMPKIGIFSPTILSYGFELRCVIEDNIKIFGPQFFPDCYYFVSTNDLEPFKISVHPSPAVDFLYVTDLAENASLRIYGYDISGKQTELFFEQGKIDISCLSNGIYVLQIFQDNRVATEKFVVNQ